MEYTIYMWKNDGSTIDDTGREVYADVIGRSQGCLVLGNVRRVGGGGIER